MTLQQLKYVVAVADKGTISKASKELFVSQPSLTNAIRELEKEMNIVIFNRTNKGISLSKEGEIFLGYARQVLEQAAILEDKYKGNDGGKKQFCVSTQHYSFAVNAFVDLIKKYGQDEYDFSLRETQTYEIIEDVAKMRSELGILFLNDFNETVINKILKSNELKFTQLFIAKPHVFISRKHPLAEKTDHNNNCQCKNRPFHSRCRYRTIHDPFQQIGDRKYRDHLRQKRRPLPQNRVHDILFRVGQQPHQSCFNHKYLSFMPLLFASLSCCRLNAR